MKQRFHAGGRAHGDGAGPDTEAGSGGDAAVEAVTVRLLRAGVGLAALLMALGLVLLFLGGPGGWLSASVRHPEGWWSGLLLLQPPALIQTGLVVLIATPVLRVLAAAVIYARERDRAFAAISVTVLALLLLGVLLARMGT